MGQRGSATTKLLIAILGFVVLASIAFVLLNPFEVSRENRDKKRLEDLTQLKEAIEFYLTNNSSNPKLCPDCQPGQTVYAAASIHLDNSDPLIVDSTSVSGSGWIPIDFSLNAGFNHTPILELPLDPINKDPYVYTFSPGQNGHFKLTAKFESKTYQEKMAGDGGALPDRYEVGTDFALPPN